MEHTVFARFTNGSLGRERAFTDDPQLGKALDAKNGVARLIDFGGYDILSKPWNEDEVLCVAARAWYDSQNEIRGDYTLRRAG